MDHIRRSRAAATLVRLGQEASGTLHVTKYHMIFETPQREIWISYPVVREVFRSRESLRILCSDFTFVTLRFINLSEAEDVYASLLALCHVSGPTELYAYHYHPAGQENTFNGWTLYNPEAEYARMGAIGPCADSMWRLTRANADYQLCFTYPAVLCVPAAIGDTALVHAAKYRAKNRFPVLSYFHKFNKCTIIRCAQPLMGYKQQRNLQDETLIQTVFTTTENPAGMHGAQNDHIIIDLRPSTNAFAQFALGGGTEIMDRYRPARKMYAGIENLHVVRDSMNRIIEALRHGDLTAEAPSPAALERSAWLRNLLTLLDCAGEVAQHVHYKCSHVVVHCSDGWDRTPQVCALAMLLLDPYFRTLEGFAVLIEKEWCSFGHAFATRHGLYVKKTFSVASEESAQSVFNNVTTFISQTTRCRQTGPIFQQFLDCVYQLTVAHPTAFEFNERFLKRLLYHSYSCQYGTFLFDSEREAREAQSRRQTRSVWNYFLARREQFLNTKYSPVDVLLPPSTVRWWAGSFQRNDKDMNDPDAWRVNSKRLTSLPKSMMARLVLNDTDGHSQAVQAVRAGQGAQGAQGEASAPTLEELKLSSGSRNNQGAPQTHDGALLHIDAQSLRHEREKKLHDPLAVNEHTNAVKERTPSGFS